MTSLAQHYPSHLALELLPVPIFHSQYSLGCFLTFAAARCVPLTGLPKMLVVRNYFGVPNPTSGPALSIQTGDIIELICADIHSPWWQVRAHAISTSHQS